MTNGTSQGLNIMIALIIFGVFVVIAYFLFGDKLMSGLATIVDDSITKELVNDNKTTELPEIEGRCAVNPTSTTLTNYKYNSLNVDLKLTNKDVGSYNKDFSAIIRDANPSKGESELTVFGKYYRYTNTFNLEKDALEGIDNAQSNVYYYLYDAIKERLVEIGLADRGVISDMFWKDNFSNPNPNIMTVYNHFNTKHITYGELSSDWYKIYNSFFDNYDSTFSFLGYTQQELSDMKKGYDERYEQELQGSATRVKDYVNRLEKEGYYKVSETEDGTMTYVLEQYFLDDIEATGEYKEFGKTGNVVIPSEINGIKKINYYSNLTLDFNGVFNNTIDSISIEELRNSPTKYYLPNLKEIHYTYPEEKEWLDEFIKTECQSIELVKQDEPVIG